MVRKHRLAQRQAKGKRENRYMIKAMSLRLNREGGTVPDPEVRKNQRMYQTFLLIVDKPTHCVSLSVSVSLR
jgi:hypothetical protein